MSREVVELRINALEGRVWKFGQTPTEEVQRSPKRIRANPASDSTTTAPPSTIRRMLRYVFPAFKTTAANDARTPNEPRIGRDDRVARPDNKLLTKLREAQKAEPEKTAMKQVLSKRVPSVTTLTLEVAHPSASTWTPALPILPSIPAQTPAHPAGRLVTAEIRPGPSLLARTRPATLLDPSNIPPPSSNSTSLTTSTPTPVTLPPPTPITRSLYPPLNPPLALRSNAIARLFPDDSPVSTTSTAKSTPPAPIAIPSRRVGKGSPSVQDLVRSFEDSGVLKGSLEKEKGGLRRSQSSAGLRDRL